MKETKLISVRLDAEDIAYIDKWCSNCQSLSRSAVISQAVALARVLVQSGHSRELMNFKPWFGDEIVEFKLKYHRKHR